MKKYLVICSLVVLLNYFYSDLVYAQDTVYVEAGFLTLTNAIHESENAGKVFKLQRGGVYVTNELIETDSANAFILVGEKYPSDQPPATIQFFALAGEGTEATVFSLNSTENYFEHIAFNGITSNEEAIRRFVNARADASNIHFDNCDFVGAWQANVQLLTENNRLVFTNCWFNNNLDKGNWQNGWVYQASNGGRQNLIKIENCTISFLGSVLEYSEFVRQDTLVFNHNTVIYTNREVFYPDPFMDMYVTNNIFYNVAMRGFVGLRPSWFPPGTGYLGDYSDDQDGDSLVGLINIDSMSTFISGVDDNDRNIHYKNNLRYTSSTVLDLHTTTTAAYQPTMNQKTENMFSSFANMIKENNIEESINPNFIQLPNGESEDEILGNYIEMVIGRRDASQRASNWPQYWGWDWDDDATGITTWPPAIDLRPQETSLDAAGDDGYPLGDLNWYEPEVLAAWENGEDNPISDVEDDLTTITSYSLEQNYPNPFNPSTTISYQIPMRSSVKLSVYDLLGREVANLINQEQNAGKYSVKFDAASLSSGIYFYRIEAGNFIQTSKMLLLK